jgi:hypothetical protein
MKTQKYGVKFYETKLLIETQRRFSAERYATGAARVSRWLRPAPACFSPRVEGKRFISSI